MNPEKLTYLFKVPQQDRQSRVLTLVFMLWFLENSGSGFSKRHYEYSPTRQARNVVSLREEVRGSWAEASMGQSS